MVDEEAVGAIRALEVLVKAAPEEFSVDLAWAYSRLSRAYARRGMTDKMIRASVSAASVLESRVASGSPTPQELRDLPLMLDNLASTYLEARRCEEARASCDRAIIAEREAVERGAASAADDRVVMDALLRTRLRASQQEDCDDGQGS